MSETPRKRARTTKVKECRACLMFYDDSRLVDIFRAWDSSWPGMGLSIAEDLAKLSNIQINVSDGYSKNICKKCCSRLQDAINFTWNVQNNDIVLRKRHQGCTDENPLWPKPIQVDKTITSNALNEMAVEVKQEVVTEDEYEMNETYSEPSEPRLDIKIEPEEITPASSSIVIDVNGPFLLSQSEPVETTTNGATEFLDERLLDDVKEEPKSEDETEPSTDMPKDCMLCFKTFNTVKGLKAHVIAVHSYDTVISPRVNRTNVCSTCNRSFATRTDLFVHETCHSKFACYVCDKKFESFYLLTKHRSKQCMKTSILPRLKTLEDVRRPVYYINDNNAPVKSTPKTDKSTIEPSINSSSQNTDKIEPNTSLVKTNPVVEQLEPRNNNKKQDVQPTETSSNEQTSSVNTNSGVEELITEWDEIPEQIQLEESSEKVSKKTIEEINLSPKKGLSEDNDQEPNESKIKEAVGSEIEVHRSEMIKTQDTRRKDSIDMDTEILEQSESCKKVIDIEVQKSDVSHIIDETVGSLSISDTEDRSEVSDKTKGIRVKKESEVDHKIDEERRDVSSTMQDNKSEVSHETKDNVQEDAVPTLETAEKEDLLKLEAKIEENIDLQTLDTCANDKTKNNPEQIGATDETLENVEPLLSKLENLKANPNGDSMEIQLEIHSMDNEDDAMDIDHDLESKIKSNTESEKHT